MELVKTTIHRLSILVIEDNPHWATVTRQALKAQGAKRVWVEKRGDAALTCIQRDRPDVIVISLAFNDCMSGLEIIRHIRRAKDIPNRRTPIIAVSSEASKSDVMAARDMGVNAFVRRPFPASLLAARVVLAMCDERSFVHSSSFAGPDRRGRSSEPYNGPNRRRSKRAQSDTETGLADA